jgi:hypothetical protein
MKQDNLMTPIFHEQVHSLTSNLNEQELSFTKATSLGVVIGRLCL